MIVAASPPSDLWTSRDPRHVRRAPARRYGSARARRSGAAQHERAVEPCAEALGQPVVGPRRGVAGIVAVVGLDRGEARAMASRATRRSAVPAPAAKPWPFSCQHGPQRAKAAEGATGSGRRAAAGWRRRPSAPGRTVTAPTATVATTIADPSPIRPDEGDPGGQQPRDRHDDDGSRRDHARPRGPVGDPRRSARPCRPWRAAPDSDRRSAARSRSPPRVRASRRASA